MQTSPYVNAVPAILAEMEKEREENGPTNGQQAETGEPEVIHVYPLEGGGFVFTTTPILDEPEAPIVDSQAPATDQHSPRKDPPYFLYFFLILLLFLGLDCADTALIALFTPTVHVTIIAQTKTVRTTATLPLALVKGRVLPSLTLTQSQTVAATGHGHQIARSATGTLTFYNGLSTAQSVARGTVLTGNDGVKVTTDAAVTIPAANPPQFGEATVSASAVSAGTMGNITALAMNITVATGLFVKNLSAFTGGLDERDYPFVKSSDIQHAVNALTPELLQSQQAALHSQLQPGEALASPTCTSTATGDHQPGDQTSHVKVTVSKTCSAVVYNKETLQSQATALLTHQARKLLGAGYKIFGSVQVAVTQTPHPPGLVLSLSLSGVWVYAMNEQALKNLVAGKPQLEAIRLLSLMPGVAHVTIAGIEDNKPLPDDVSHIHLFILVAVADAR